MCVCTRALGQAFPFQRSVNSVEGRRQHDSSGQVDTARSFVSRPRHQRASSNGTPTVTENSPSVEEPVCVEHQNVPDGVSVYWWCSTVRFCWVNAARAWNLRHTRWPSTAPVTSIGSGRSSFS